MKPGKANYVQWILGLLVCITNVQCQQSCQVPSPVSGCDCKLTSDNKMVINCKYKSLTSIPAITQSTEQFSELQLAHNDIMQINNDSFAGLLVEKIDLSENNVHVIENGAFKGLENVLKHLILEVKNRVYDLTLSSLYKLTMLDRLELDGFNAPSTHPVLFDKIPQLKVLHLKNCSIQTITDGTFNSLSNLQELKIDKNQLTLVPTSSISSLVNLQILSLGGNKLTELNNDAFSSLTKLQELDLNENMLTTINSGAFNGLQNALHTLIIYDNQLTEVGVISSLTNLQTLTINKNKIVSIPDGTFNQMSQLSTLWLPDNLITSITSGMFQGLETTLTDLSLDGNPITSIQDGAFAQMTSLTDILLDRVTAGGLHNVIKAGTFRGTESTLKVLSLEDNQLTEADLDGIRGLTRLRTLSLCTNKISSIPDYQFSGMTNMRTLKLCDNTLNKLTQQSLYGLLDLKTLEIEGNQIVSLEKCLFHQFTKRNEMALNLARNSLKCDCNLKWFREWIDIRFPTDSEKRDKTAGWKCSGSSHNGQSLYLVPVDQFTCSTSPPDTTCEQYTTTTAAPGAEVTSPSSRGIQIETTSGTSSSITINWSVVYSKGINGYLIKYYDTAKPSIPETSRTLPASSNSYKVENLSPGVEYIVCVVPVTNSGEETSKCGPAQQTNANSGPSTEKSTDDNSVGVIVGSCLGAVAAIAIITGAIIFVLYRRKKAIKAKQAQSMRIATIGGGSSTGERGAVGGTSLGPTSSFDSKAYMYNIDNQGTDRHIPVTQRQKGSSLTVNIDNNTNPSMEYSPTENGKIPGQNNLNKNPSHNTKRISDRYKEIPLPPVPSHPPPSNGYTPSPVRSRRNEYDSPKQQKNTYEKAYPDDHLQGAVGGRSDSPGDGYLNPVMLNEYERSRASNNNYRDKGIDNQTYEMPVEEFI